MRNKLKLALLIIVFGLGYSEVKVQGNLSPATPAPTPTPTLPLNKIKIGHCYVSDSLKEENDKLIRDDIESFVTDERKRGAVMDVRPFAINQTTGKLSFAGNTGRISIVNMNPFIYTYKVTVAQQELMTTALSDALKLFLPPSPGSLPGLQSGTV